MTAFKRYFFDGLHTVLYIITLLTIVGCLSSMLSGCMTGHNVYREKEMTGLDLSLPIGQSFIGLQIGATKTVTAVIRGGVAFETTSANHGGLFGGAGGQSKISQLKTNTQLNEGYLAEVLCSTNVPVDVKLLLASNLNNAATAPYFPGSILQTEGSTIHIGRNAILSNNVERISPEARGLDRLVDKAAEVIGTNVVNDVLDTTHEVVHDTVNPMQGTIKQVGTTATDVGCVVTHTANQIKRVLYTLVLTIVGAVLLLMAIALLMHKRQRRPKTIRVDADLEQIMPTCVSGDPPTPVKEPEPKQTKPEKPRIGWFNRLRTWVVYIVLTIMRLFAMLPPGIRKRIRDILTEYWKNKRAEKRKKKDSC